MQLQPAIWPKLIDLALNAASSPLTRAQYRTALEDFLRWRSLSGNPPFQRATVQEWKRSLEERGLAPATVNQRLAAVRKLADEASANGFLDPAITHGIQTIRGARRRTVRMGNWITRAQAQQLLNLPDVTTRKGVRDSALLAVLLGCALRRSEVVRLKIEDVQQREGRWVLSDIKGKHNTVRTVPVPAWVKVALDAWTECARLTSGPIFRAVDRFERIGPSISSQTVLRTVAAYGNEIGVPLKPHDLRRTCAKLCRQRGAEIEQIQLLLGHASVQTTEKYLGIGQDLLRAPNDRLDFHVKVIG